MTGDGLVSPGGSFMRSLFRLTLVLSAALLALPPGWCCMAPALATAKKAPARHCCCPGEPAPEEAPSPEQDNAPAPDCCCHAERSLPPGFETAPDLLAGPLLALPADEAPRPGAAF